MEVDLNDYLIVREYIRNWIIHHPDRVSIFWATLLSAVTHAPVVATLTFFSEFSGHPEDYAKEIESVTKFYRYDRIIPIREENL